MDLARHTQSQEVIKSLVVKWKQNTKFQYDWFLSVKITCVCVTKTKPHPLSHPHVVINAHPVTWRKSQIQPSFIGPNRLSSANYFFWCDYDKTTPIATPTVD